MKRFEWTEKRTVRQCRGCYRHPFRVVRKDCEEARFEERCHVKVPPGFLQPCPLIQEQEGTFGKMSRNRKDRLFMIL